MKSCSAATRDFLNYDYFKGRRVVGLNGKCRNGISKRKAKSFRVAALDEG